MGRRRGWGRGRRKRGKRSEVVGRGKGTWDFVGWSNYGIALASKEHRAGDILRHNLESTDSALLLKTCLVIPESPLIKIPS